MLEVEAMGRDILDAAGPVASWNAEMATRR